jgi:hypothetical protein
MPPDNDGTTAPRLSLQAIYDGLMAHITGRSGAPAWPEVARLVEGDRRASAGERVHVYEHMYRARIAEALDAQFPRLARWMGAEAFAELCAAYVADEPSRHPSLRYLGQRLTDWMARRTARDGDPGALAGAGADLARLEWARVDVFDAADEATLSIETVRAWPAERFGEIPLRLIGAHRRLQLDHPVTALWDAIGSAAASAEIDREAIAAATAMTSRAGESLLVWRQGTSVFHRATDAAEAVALARLAGGTTFGAVCEALSRDRSEDEATAQAFAWLSTWADDELLVARDSGDDHADAVADADEYPRRRA